MKIEQVIETYDYRYAAEYDNTFLLDGWTRGSVEFQIRLLEQNLRGARNWLDVACGTGYALSRFPDVPRAGLDLSAAMLDAARRQNPGVSFVNRNFLEPAAEWNDKWDLVSCMWWAYCMVESISEIQQLIGRLADWTSPGGKCFLPLCNPQKFDRHNIRIPYIDARIPGRCMITGITWTWIQENGKRHDDVVSPQVDHMVALFEQHFEQVEVVEGPKETVGDGWRVQDVLLAQRKRSRRPTADIFRSADGERPGSREWLFSTCDGTLAGLSYPSRNLKRVRVTIDERGAADPGSVQAQKVGYSVTSGRRYRLTFEARAEAGRPVSVGVSLGDPPFHRLGLYQQFRAGRDWQTFEFEFTATGTSERARVHFDLGQSDITVDVGDVSLSAV